MKWIRKGMRAKGASEPQRQRVASSGSLRADEQ